MKYAIIILGLATAALAQQHSTVPVILVDDLDYGIDGGGGYWGYTSYGHFPYGPLGGCVVQDGQVNQRTRTPDLSFGQLYQILQNDGAPVFYFDVCKERIKTNYAASGVVCSPNYTGYRSGTCPPEAGLNIEPIVWTTNKLTHVYIPPCWTGPNSPPTDGRCPIDNPANGPGLSYNEYLDDMTTPGLSTAFGNFLANTLASTGASQVDVVALGVGGLIVRTYVAGLVRSLGTTAGSDTLYLPTNGQPAIAQPYTPNSIRKLVLIGSPNKYGISFAGIDEVAAVAYTGYDPLGFDYNNSQIYNVPSVMESLGRIKIQDDGYDKLTTTLVRSFTNDPHNIDTIAIAGAAFRQGLCPTKTPPNYTGCPSDGMTTVENASVTYITGDPLRTRVLNQYATHDRNIPCWGCSPTTGLAYVADTTQPTYQILRGFLDDGANNGDWWDIGNSTPY
jgi:hypothetical protein